MRLGVDFGTTRIVIAAADRGNYPLVSFEADDATYEWMPPLIALRGEERLYGWNAWKAQLQPGWTLVRSIKRVLEDAGPETRLDLGEAGHIPVRELLTGLARELRRNLSLLYGDNETFDILLGVPANANSNQRFLTVDAFRHAGFSVLGLLNEPSAASIEYGHRQKITGRVLVYDLGGGTFDVSLVDLDERNHSVIATEGISNLGGDDFDLLLAEMAVGPEKLAEFTPARAFLLEEECRRVKETLHPNTRRLILDLETIAEDLSSATVQVADYYARCRPLVERTIEAAKRVAEASEAPVDSLYVTGGGSELPLVSRMLRDEFGRKVKRSEYTRSATAIGLAIQADAASGYALSELFTRNFGVWREGEAGQRMVFDCIFPQGTRLPSPGTSPLLETRTYQPVHNVGHFRYLEAAQVDHNGDPLGDVALWDDILFPFDPSKARVQNLTAVPVERLDFPAAQEIEERYTCDSAGMINVTIHNLTALYSREYKLGRWSSKPAAIKPGARRSRKAVN